MTYDLVLALSLFALVTSITPGPNNLMLMASGANFGFRRTIPHMLGIGIGFTVMVLMVGAGLVRVFDAWPPSYTLLRVASIGYLLVLAWKIANAAAPRAQGAKARPLGFVQAAAFQWVNPKAWAMALSAVSAYAPDHSLTAVALVALIFGAINLPSVSTWTVLGQQLARLLTDPRRLTLFNRGMAALLVLSLYPILRP
ncbi:MAG: LysE family translocator [Marinibacterium sp.]|nr:LysE family translocator [Marinibacterium sp.]